MTTETKKTVGKVVGVVVSLALLYVTFRVASAGWHAGDKK